MNGRRVIELVLWLALVITAPVLWGWAGLWASGAVFAFSMATGDTWTIIRGRSPYRKER